jgi:hypothetical protein
MESLGWRQRRGSSPAARRGARRRAGLTPVSASNILSCERETHQTSSGRSNSLDADHGIYGDLSGASGSKRMTRSGRTHGFGPRRGCPCGAERADRGFVDRNGAGDAGQSDGPTQAGAMPVEIRREWLVSLRWRIGGDGIMRCRSRLPPARVSVGAWAHSRARRSR